MNAPAVTDQLPQGRDVLHVEEVSIRTGVPEEAIREAIKRKEIKAGRLGRRLLIPISEYHRIIAMQPTVVA